jgi:hypothetical protein
MYKATLAAALLALTMAGSATATPMSAAGGLVAAIPDTNLTETVHCRPWRHWHRWGWGRGCGPRYYRWRHWRRW